MLARRCRHHDPHSLQRGACHERLHGGREGSIVYAERPVGRRLAGIEHHQNADAFREGIAQSGQQAIDLEVGVFGRFHRVFGVFRWDDAGASLVVERAKSGEVDDRHVAIRPAGLALTKRRRERGKHLVGSRRDERRADVEDFRRARKETLFRARQRGEQPAVFVGLRDDGEREAIIRHASHDDRHLAIDRQEHPHKQHDEGDRGEREKDSPHHEPQRAGPLRHVVSATPGRLACWRCGRRPGSGATLGAMGTMAGARGVAGAP